MRTLVHVLILLLEVVFCWKCLQTERAVGDIGRSSNGATIVRRKRGSVTYLPVIIAAREGKRAVQKLIQGAKETPSYAAEFKYFKKPGGFPRALQDFKQLRPKAVIEFGGDGDGAEIMMGRVGDRKIVLKRRGGVGNPTIELIKLRPESTNHIMDIVTYVDEL